MKRIYKTLPFIFVLAACGSEVDTSDGDALSSTRLMAEDAGTVGDVQTAGQTLTAQSNMTSGMSIDWDQDITDKDASTFAITKNADGSVTMDVDGQQVQLTSADYATGGGAGYGFSTDSNPNFDDTVTPYANLFTFDADSLTDALSGDNNGYVQVWQYYLDPIGEGEATRAFAVVGTYADIDDLPTNARAQYLGSARAQVADKDGYGGYASEQQLQADLSITADFGANEISGTLSNFESRDFGGEWASIEGGAVLEQASINSNTDFGGAIVMNETLAAEFDISTDTVGTYNGGVFGPEGQQVAGTVSMENEDVTIYGFFKGEKSN